MVVVVELVSTAESLFLRGFLFASFASKRYMFQYSTSFCHWEADEVLENDDSLLHSV